jgi:cytochrome b pre-mRNA-processing protein 3
VSIFRRIFRGGDPRDALTPLYHAVVREGRTPGWYAEGGVPDTIDGRFDMIAAVLTLVLLRLEAADEPGRAPSALLTELFIADMDGQLRQIGIGDLVVGKHIGKMMGMLGGRLTAYRDAFAEGGDLHGALERNLWRGVPPGEAAEHYAVDRLTRLRAALTQLPLDALLAGVLPTL